MPGRSAAAAWTTSICARPFSSRFRSVARSCGAGLDGDDPTRRTDLAGEHHGDDALVGPDVEDECPRPEPAPPEFGDLGESRVVAVVPAPGQGVGEQHLQGVAAVGVLDHASREGPDESPDPPGAQAARPGRRQSAEEPAALDRPEHSDVLPASPAG